MMLFHKYSIIIFHSLLFFMMITSIYGNAIKVGKRSAFSMKQTISGKISSVEKPSVRNKNPRISFSKTSELTPIASNLYRCNFNKTEYECKNKTSEFRNKVVSELKKSMTSSGSDNAYNVEYNRLNQLNETVSSISILLKNQVKMLRKKDKPFKKHKLGQLFPKKKLFQKISGKSCVIVSSAGSLVSSNLGEFIDSHDIVMRFNHAPTENYESDVGSKTTIRIVNSQVVSKPEFNFLNSSIFKNVSLAAWDPAAMNASISDWLQKPDFDLFTNYEKFMVENPTADFHIIDPRSLWNLWKVLQDFANVPIVRNIPSSGFIGIAILLPVCSDLDIVEYIPSTRLNGRCHYYSEEINLRCTFGAWHPLAAEKLFALSMNYADDFTVYQRGILRIKNLK